MVKKFMKPTVGKDLPTILSKSLVRDWYAAIGQQVINEYDADAEKVYVDVDPDTGTITIKGNGEGMDIKGLESFFRLGDSPKKLEPISPIKKRKRIGKHGIATILLQYLGHSFGIDSIKDGYLHHIDEGVVEGDVEGTRHEISKSLANGTTITIRDLTFKIGNEFDVDKLYKRLQWTIPNKPDFDVFVNGQFVKKRGVVEYARVYKIHKRVGKNWVRGRIYVKTSGAKELDGIRIYVNDCAVGDPSMFKLSEIHSSLVEGRIQGEVHADFLEDIVTLDGSQFQEDERLDKIKEAVLEVLRGILVDLTHGESRRAYFQVERTYDSIEKALMLAEEQLNSRSDKDYQLKLATLTESGAIARLDASNIININAASKMFTLLERGSKKLNKRLSEVYLKRAFLIAAAYAINNEQYGQDADLDDLLEKQITEMFRKFPGIGTAVNKYIQGKILVPLNEIYFNNYRLYDHSEISHLTGRSPIVVRLLHTCGALRGTKDHLFSKEDIIKALELLEGYTSCIEVVDKRYGGISLEHRREEIEIRYDIPKPTPLDINLSNMKIKNFSLLNVGRRHPMFFVPLEQANAFHSYVLENKLCDNHG